MGNLNSSGMAKQWGRARIRASNFQGVETPWPLAPRKNGHPTRNKEPQDVISRRRTQGVEAEAQGRLIDPRWANPRGLTGTWLQAEGGKGGSNGRGKCWKMQECGAGRRINQQRLASVRWGQRPDGRRIALGEEVGRGCKREGIQLQNLLIEG